VDDEGRRIIDARKAVLDRRRYDDRLSEYDRQITAKEAEIAGTSPDSWVPERAEQGHSSEGGA
jgi:hypothetical protein